MAIQIKTEVTEALSREWPDRTVKSNYMDNHSRSRYRYIQVSVPGLNGEVDSLHYEYNCGPGYSLVAFHFEGKYASPNFLELRRYVRKSTEKSNTEKSNDVVEWRDFQSHANTECTLKSQCLDSIEQVIAEFRRLMEILDPIIQRGLEEAPSLDLMLTSHAQTEQREETEQLTFADKPAKAEVCFLQTNFDKLMSLPLNIPSYQRNYCWNNDNISNLWKSLSMASGDIHLGNIIMQERDGQYDIIDGQQRLITLSLFAMAQGYKHSLPLLKCRLRSSQSTRNLANAKQVIKSLCQQRDNSIHTLFATQSGKPIRFGLLILSEKTSLDLAYTFFSSQNSNGVPLSDYDLLKAHHLQYISNTAQARHLASRWDRLLSAPPTHGGDDSLSGKELKMALGRHIFRLRSWMRFHDTRKSAYAVRDEYVAAPIINAIPPFGEKFSFYEKIQGGTHFFAYAENFVDQYKMFRKTDQAIALNGILSYSTHKYYKDVIETLLFGYFLKFGTSYLTEAFFVISSIIADDRYASGQMRQKRLFEHAKNSRIIMMIDQATSPTFFLAEALGAITINPLTLDDEEFRGKRLDFYNELRQGVKSLLPSVTEECIKGKICEIYVL